jgi:purine-binding chemotaxis protein CheW
MPTEFALSHAAMAMTEIPEDVLRVLEERARQLARPLDGDAMPETTSLLVLQVGPERYAVDVDAVREIKPREGVTPLPGLPSFWSGLVNQRGNLVPVLDLTTYLGLPSSPNGETEETKLVFVGAEGVEVAFVVDGVREIRHTPAQDLHPSVPVEGDGVRIVQHVTKDLVSVLDLSYLLRDPALTVGVDAR